MVVKVTLSGEMSNLTLYSASVYCGNIFSLKISPFRMLDILLKFFLGGKKKAFRYHSSPPRDLISLFKHHTPLDLHYKKRKSNQTKTNNIGYSKGLNMCEAPCRYLTVPSTEASEAVQAPRSTIQKLKTHVIALLPFCNTVSGEYVMLQHL